MDQLRLEGKSRTCQFRELASQKLLGANLIALLKSYDIFKFDAQKIAPNQAAVSLCMESGRLFDGAEPSTRRTALLLSCIWKGFYT